MARAHKLDNVHPGEVLREEFLLPLDLTPYALAKAIHVPQTRVAALVHGRRGVTADTALRLARFFGTTAKFWTGLQEDYDLEEERRCKALELAAILPYKARPAA